MNVCFLSSVSFIWSHFLFHSLLMSILMSPTDFVSLEEDFIYCPLTVHFSCHSCCFFILYFISHSAFWKHRVSFWLIFLSFCNASVSCMIYAIQTHKRQGKLCLAALDWLCSYIQHLVDVSLPDLFSSGAARGGVGVTSCSSQAFPVGEHLFWRSSFLYPSFCWVIPHQQCGLSVSPYLYCGHPHPGRNTALPLKSWRALTPLLAFFAVLHL